MLSTPISLYFGGAILSDKYTIEFNSHSKAEQTNVNDAPAVKELAVAVRAMKDEQTKKVASDVDSKLLTYLINLTKNSKGSGSEGISASMLEKLSSESSIRIAKEVINKLSKDPSKNVDMSSIINKAIEKEIGNLSNRLEKSLNIKIDTKEIVSAIQGTIPKSLDGLTKEVLSMVNVVKSSWKSIEVLLGRIASATKSGGKIDSSEIGAVFSSAKQVYQDYKEISSQIDTIKKSLKEVAKESEVTANRLGDALGSVKKMAEEKVTSTVSKISNDPTAVTREFLSTLKNMVNKSPELKETGLGKTILRLDASADSLDKVIVEFRKFGRTIREDAAQGTAPPERTKKLLDAFGNLTKVIGEVPNNIVPNDKTSTMNKVAAKISTVTKMASSLVTDVEAVLKDVEIKAKVKVEIDKNELHKTIDSIHDEVKRTNPKVLIDTFGRSDKSVSKPNTDVTKYNLYNKNAVMPSKEGHVNITEGAKTLTAEAAKIKKATEDNIKRLSASLYKLQDQIVESLDREFAESKSGWGTVKPSGINRPGGAFKLADKQWTMQIADTKRLQKTMNDYSSPLASLVDRYKDQAVGNRVQMANGPTKMTDLVGQWLKSVSTKQIKAVDLDDVAKEKLINIKSLGTGPEVNEAIRVAIGKSFGQGSNLLNVFKKTYAESEAKKELQREGIVKNVAIPSAFTTPIGDTSFQTTHGSNRALPKFVKFQTGFETLYKKMEESGNLDLVKPLSKRISGLGIRPENREDAEKLSVDMLEAVRSSFKEPKDAKGYFKDLYTKAATNKGFEIEQLGGPKAEEFKNKVKAAMDSFDSLAGNEQTFEKFVDTMKELNLTAYDVIRSLNKIDVKNVYDIMGEVLEGNKKKSPIRTLAKEPTYERSVRQFDSAIGEIEGLMPLIEGNRPRRGYHQENVVNLLTRTGSFIKNDHEDRLNTEDQKKLIKDLNLELSDTLKALEHTGELPAGIKRISSLGIPESQAGAVEEYRTTGGTGKLEHLKTLNATNVKMYAEDLTSLAPFQQFQQAGRNIANVTNAMVNLNDNIDTPKLRSEHERALIESGRYGQKGYGYNVTAEMRNTAANFEDQIVISGKLAKALTSAVSNLVKPSQGGRLSGSTGEGYITGLGVSDIKEGEITKSAREYMSILGIDEKYAGRADKVLISEVEKVIATIRGESVEVQQAKLAETFMNYFGRKLTTRYGSKGVSIAPNMAGIMEQHGGKDFKVRPEESLGYQVAPKSMGQLSAELFGSKVSDEFKKKLISSGNKFMIDIFQNPAMVSADEAEKTKQLYNEFTQNWGNIFTGGKKPDLGVSGIELIKKTHQEKLGGKSALVEKKPIDVRISSYGAAKRGLQTEFMESIFNNLTGTGEGGTTTLRDKADYSSLFKEGGIAKYTKALGYTGTEKSEKELAPDLYKLFGGKGNIDDALLGGSDEDKKKAALAKRAAALEAMSSYYSTIIDEFGKPRKGLVGEKFLEIIEEPHLNPEWQLGQVESGAKGAKFNLPAFSAYSSVFGENSEMMKEIQGSQNTNAKKHWEYLKALQTIQGKDSQIYKNITEDLRTVDVKDIDNFNLSTGVHGKKFIEENGQTIINPRSFQGTILDVDKFPDAFKMAIPTGKIGASGEATRENLYVPGAIARGTYPEPLIAGEFGMDTVARRLTHVVDMAKQLQEAMDSPEEMLESSKVVAKVKPIVSSWTKRANEIADSRVETPESEEELRNILDKMTGVLSTTQAPSQALINTGGRTEYQYIQDFYAKQMSEIKPGVKTKNKAYATTIGTVGDLIVGKDPSNPNNSPEQIAAPTGLTRAADAGKSVEFADRLGIDVVKDTLAKRVEALQKAKIDYYNTLAEEVVGKGGTVDELFLSRKIPAVMGKAVTAVVDKREDIDKFKTRLSSMSKYGEDFSKQISKLGGVSETHGEAIDAYTKMGIPTLRQEEIGIPETFASKLPLEFTKKFNTSDKFGVVAQKPETVNGTLLDLLKYIENLKSYSAGEGSVRQEEISKHIQEDLVPYIESIRYPFTGTSSIAPFKPKLIGKNAYKDSTGRSLSANSLIVPGVPEGLDKMKPIIEEVQERIDIASKQRETLQTSGGSKEEIERLTSIIRELSAAISDVIPKYVAQAQKLDFDGDQIEIHSATTAGARKDIETHFKRFHEASPGGSIRTQDVYMKNFLSKAAEINTTGEYVLAESQQAFEKKFPAGKGFEFLKSPFLNEKLDYMSTPQALDVMSGNKSIGDVSNVVNDVLKTMNRPQEEINEVMSKINSLNKGEDYSSGIVKVLEEYYVSEKHKQDKILEQVEANIKRSLYNQKSSDTIEAQLYKLHTGPETEAMYRVHRVAESAAGFGGGLLKDERNSSDYFKSRFPNTKASGGNPEEEFHTMINEMLRFGIQKGMDVKHAGEKPVAGEMVGYLSRGPAGAKDLWSRISDKKDDTFKDLRDFSESNKKAIEMRLGELPTSEVLDEARKISVSRGEEADSLGSMDRAQLVSVIVDKIGFKGFLEEMSLLIKKEAIDGLVAQAKQWSPATKKQPPGFLPPVVGDINTWANKVVEDQMSSGKLNLSQTIAEARTPLYGKRTFFSSPLGEYKRHQSYYGDIPTPTDEISALKDSDKKYYGEKFRNAKASAVTIQHGTKSFMTGASGTGAYADMIKGTVANLNKQFTEIRSHATSILKEGYDPASAKSMDTAARVVNRQGVSSFANSILDMKSGREEEINRLSELVGLDKQRPTEQLDIKHETAKTFADVKNAELKDSGKSGEEIKTEVNAYVEEMVSKAQALKQLDRITDALLSKRSEGKVLHELFPEEGVSSTRSAYDVEREKSFQEARNRITQAAGGGRGGSTMGGFGRSDQPPSGPSFSSGGLGGASGDPVPVYIVGASSDVTINVKGLAGAGMTFDSSDMTPISEEIASLGEEFRQQSLPSFGRKDDILQGKSREMKNRVDAFATKETSLSPEDLDRYLAPRPPVAGNGIKSVFSNLSELHNQAKLYQKMKGVTSETLQGMPKEVGESIEKVGSEGPNYQSFIELTNKLKELSETDPKALGGKKFYGSDFTNAWKLYKAAVGDYYISKIKQAEEDMKKFKASGDVEEEDQAYGEFERGTVRLQEFMKRGLGKASDIYTDQKRFVYPGLAQAAGVYMNPEEIMNKIGEPLGDDEQLIKSFKEITQGLQGQTVKSSGATIQKLMKDISTPKGMEGVQGELTKILADSEKFSRLGPEVVDAWDFERMVSGATRLREALQQVKKQSGDLNAEQRQSLDVIIKDLKKVEGMYSHIDFGNRSGMGIVPVAKFEPEEDQKAKHARNIQSISQYFGKSTEEGGPEVGRKFNYTEKVFGDAGEVIKNNVWHFNKYGEEVLSSGEKVGLFNRSQSDLIEKMQKSGSSFTNATRRVVMWGAASRLIYGGVSYLGKSLDQVADIESNVAELRMVMNPLDTDFNKMAKSATGFAKQYGVPVKGILDSMKVFAQQGLTQEEVIDRTKTSTLASNVTTLNAKDATEALTSAMVIFREEGEQSMRFLDAWSEVEAKHAVTAGDMANAIKKSAAAAKTAGFTFDELNGIVAAIGSTTRQTGNEVGTSMRFIARRLFTEEGPKALAKLPTPISTVSGTGEFKPGFKVLNELAGQWKDLTNAQKMNVATSIGGTRQYNSVLVLMDQWDEALRGIRNSTNSKGSAERRNAEVMNTYAKQMEQAKAAATDLKMELGKIVLPSFKVGLKAITLFTEAVTNIPGPIKVAATGALLLFGALAKGVPILDDIIESFSKGGAVFGNFGESLSKQLKVTKFELTGKGKGDDLFGLKTLTSGASKTANAGKDMSKTKGPEILSGVVEQGNKLSDFNSLVGKSLFTLMSVGKAYNEVVGKGLVKTGAVGEKVGESAKAFGDFLNISDDIAGLAASGIKSPKKIYESLRGAATARGLGKEAVETTLAEGGIKALGTLGKRAAAFATELAGYASVIVGEVVDSSSEYLGAGGHKILKDFTTQNTGVVKAIAPLAVTAAALAPALKATYKEYIKMGQSAQDYESSMASAVSKNDDQLKSVRGMIQSYDTLEDKVKDIQKVSDPDVKKRRMDAGTYESPLVSMQKVQKDVISMSNQLADSNLGLVVGYDKLGNAVLKSTGSFKDHLKELEKLKVLQGVNNQVSIMDRYTKDLSAPGGGEKFKFAMKELADSFPVIGDLVSRNIKISPAKSLEMATEDLNKRINLKQKYPLATAADEDIKKRQKVLSDARESYQSSYSDFLKAYKGAVAPSVLNSLGPDKIKELLTSSSFKEAYKLQILVDPKFKLVKGVKPEDIMGKDWLSALNPKLSGILDVNKEFTKANLESAGITARTDKKARPGDIVTFMDGFADRYDIAGKQAVVKLKETSDGVFEWLVEYINTKTLKVEERPLVSIEPLIENIFPAERIKEDVSDRIDALNTFVAGASAGLVGITEKAFKKDFSLGERFFSEIPTTTLLQGNFGFDMKKGYGAVSGMEGFSKDIKDYYFKPMEDLKNLIEPFEKVKLEGADADSFNMGKDAFDEINNLLTVLKNNQVVLQFRAVFVDLMKEFSEGERILKQNVAIVKQRFEVEKETAGLMKGVSKGIADYDLGVSKVSELSPRQSLLKNSGSARDLAQQLKVLQMDSESKLGQLDSVKKATTNLEDIKKLASASGVSLTKENLGKYVETVAKQTDSAGPFMELNKISAKTESNTAATVDRLDSLLENQGDPEAIERMLSKFSDSSMGMFDRQPKTIANAMERVAGIRNRAEKSGNQEAVMNANKVLDQLTKKMIGEVGFEEGAKFIDKNFTLFKKDFTSKEYKQRAFSGMDSEVFLKKMGEYAPEEKKWYWFDKKAFKDSKELANIRKVQEDNRDETFVTGNTLAKIQAALAAAAYIEKRGNNAVANKLDEQIKLTDLQITKGREQGQGEPELRDLFMKRTGLVAARDESKKSADFYGTVSALSAAGVAADELAMTFGLTENQVKALNVAAVGTYGAMKVASKVVGMELPESAKNFEKEFKGVAGELLSGKNPKDVDYSGLRSAGKTLMKDTASKTKESFGTKDVAAEAAKVANETFKASFDRQVKSPDQLKSDIRAYRAKGGEYEKYDTMYQKQREELSELIKNSKTGIGSPEYNDLLKKQNAETFNWKRSMSGKDADKIMSAHPLNDYMRGGDYESLLKQGYGGVVDQSGQVAKRGAEKDVGTSRLKQFVAAYGAVALTDYVGKKKSDRTALATLEDKMQSEQEVMLKALEANPQAAERVMNDIYKNMGAAGEDANIETITKSLVQDTDVEYKKLVDMIGSYNKEIVRLHEETVKAMAKAQAELFDKETRESDNMAAYGSVVGEKRRQQTSAVNRRFSLENVTQSGLRDYAGDMSLPVAKEDLTTQQRIYTESSDSFKSMINAYADGGNVLEAQRSRIDWYNGRMEEEREIIVSSKDSDTVEKAKERYSGLRSELEKQIAVTEAFSQKLNTLGTAYMNLNKFSEAMYKLKNSLEEVNIQEAVDRFAGLRTLRENLDMLIGGSHPDAVQSITPEEERMGKKSGFNLIDLKSTKYDVEQARLYEQLRTNPQQAYEIRQQIDDLPVKRQRELTLRDQQKYDNDLRRSLDPWQEQMSMLQKVKVSSSLSPELKSGIGTYQSLVDEALGRSTEIMSKDSYRKELEANKDYIGPELYESTMKELDSLKGVENVYRGVPVWTEKELAGEVPEMLQGYYKEAVKSSSEGLSQQANISDPIVSKIDETNAILRQIADEEFGLSVDTFDKKKDYTDLSNSIKPESFFEKISKYFTGKAFGGYISGPGGPTTDSIPAWLSSGEYVIRASSAQRIGIPTLNYLNNMGQVPTFASTGGSINKDGSVGFAEGGEAEKKKLARYFTVYKDEMQEHKSLEDYKEASRAMTSRISSGSSGREDLWRGDAARERYDKMRADRKSDYTAYTAYGDNVNRYTSSDEFEKNRKIVVGSKDLDADRGDNLNTPGVSTDVLGFSKDLMGQVYKGFDLGRNPLDYSKELLKYMGGSPYNKDNVQTNNPSDMLFDPDIGTAYKSFWGNLVYDVGSWGKTAVDNLKNYDYNKIKYSLFNDGERGYKDVKKDIKDAGGLYNFLGSNIGEDLSELGKNNKNLLSSVLSSNTTGLDKAYNRNFDDSYNMSWKAPIKDSYGHRPGNDDNGFIEDWHDLMLTPVDDRFTNKSGITSDLGGSGEYKYWRGIKDFFNQSPGKYKNVSDVKSAIHTDTYINKPYSLSPVNAFKSRMKPILYTVQDQGFPAVKTLSKAALRKTKGAAKSIYKMSAEELSELYGVSLQRAEQISKELKGFGKEVFTPRGYFAGGWAISTSKEAGLALIRNQRDRGELLNEDEFMGIGGQYNTQNYRDAVLEQEGFNTDSDRRRATMRSNLSSNTKYSETLPSVPGHSFSKEETNPIYDVFNRLNRIKDTTGLSELEKKVVSQQRERADSLIKRVESGEVNLFSDLGQTLSDDVLVGGTRKEGASVAMRTPRFSDNDNPAYAGVVDTILRRQMGVLPKPLASRSVGVVGSISATKNTFEDEQLKKSLTDRTSPDKEDPSWFNYIMDYIKGAFGGDTSPMQSVKDDKFFAGITNSAAARHNGGVIPHTGLVFAKGGEVIGYAGGGPSQENDFGLSFLNNSSAPVKFDTSSIVRELEAAKVEVTRPDWKIEVDSSRVQPIKIEVPDWKIKVEDTSLPVIKVEHPNWKIGVDSASLPSVKVEQPNWKVEVGDVKVEQPNWKIGVDTNKVTSIQVERPSWKIDVNMPTNDLTIKVDASAAAMSLSDAITTAARSIQIASSGSNSNATGADRLDYLAKAVSDTRDQILNFKATVDDTVKMFGTTNNQTLDIDRKVAAAVEAKVVGIQQDVNSIRVEVGNLASTQRQKEVYYQVQFSDLDMRLRNTMNITGVCNMVGLNH